MLKPTWLSHRRSVRDDGNAVAAAYMNISLAHTWRRGQRNDRREHPSRGDEALALHFRPTSSGGSHRTHGRGPLIRSRRRVSPRGLVVEIARSNGHIESPDWLEREGVGAHITLDKPFLLVSSIRSPRIRPWRRQIVETLMGCTTADADDHAVANADAGPRHFTRDAEVPRGIQPEYIRFYKNFPIETYVRLMISCACAIGNSSAPLREGASWASDGQRRHPAAGRDRAATYRRGLRPSRDRGRGREATRARAISVEHLYATAGSARIAKILANRRCGAEAIVILKILGIIPARGGSKGIRTRISRCSADGRCWPTRLTR